MGSGEGCGWPVAYGLLVMKWVFAGAPQHYFLCNFKATFLRSHNDAADAASTNGRPSSPGLHERQKGESPRSPRRSNAQNGRRHDAQTPPSLGRNSTWQKVQVRDETRGPIRSPPHCVAQRFRFRYEQPIKHAGVVTMSSMVKRKEQAEAATAATDVPASAAHAGNAGSR